MKDINNKLTPQSLELEEAVLGAMMVDQNGVEIGVDILNPSVFYKDGNRYIFEAILDLYLEKNPVDLLTVSVQLKKNAKLEQAGGDFYLIQLTQKISSSAHIDFHCRILLQKYIQRTCISIGLSIVSDSYNENTNTFELMERSYKELGKVTDLINIGVEKDFSNSVLTFLDNAQNTTKGVPSSIEKLQNILDGYQKSDLIILAARPGMGKTALVLNEIVNCGLNNVPVVFFSLEMSEKQIITRLLSIISGIEISKIRGFNLNHDEIQYLKQCQQLLSKMPIIIDDNSGLSPIEIKIKCNKLKKDKGIEIVFVDYLQLMVVKDKKVNREQEVSIISGSLKSLAKDLDIPIVALSQLSRAVETRGASKRPMLSDLRDSGAVEQDADIVMFLYRPEYYKIEQWDDENQNSTLNEAEIIVAKYRNGEPGFARVGCELKYMRFINTNELGKNIQSKYFKNEKEVYELPRIQAEDAFEHYSIIEDSGDGIPF